MLKINKTNRRTLVDSLKDQNFHLGAEVGVRTGWYAKYILDNTDMKMIAIDPWEPNAELQHADRAYQECLKRLSPYGDRVEMVKAYSPAVTSTYKDGSFDFVYIDALHDYDSVKKDIVAWWSKIRVGGILAGHDYSPSQWPGVVHAVYEFAHENKIKYFLTGVVGNAKESHTGDFDEYDGDVQSWFFIKQ
tara:strand:- start:85 stop:654 length:570 start_codon:yes stop_codon:yes gene_type:complete